MKKLFNRALPILLVLTLFVTMLSAAALEAPTITVETKNVKTTGATQTVELQLSIKDNPGLTACMLSLTYDPALTLTGVTAGTALSGLEFVLGGDVAANPIKMLWSGAAADTTDGVIATLTFTAPAEVGTYPVAVAVSDGDVIDNYLATVTPTLVDGAITVESAAPAHTPGDMDGNGTVNMKDSVLLMRYVAGGYGVELSLDVADIDHNGTVNMKDTVLLMRYIAGGYGVVLS